MPPRGRGDALAGGAGNRLGLVEAGVILALAGILAGEQLLQADDLRPGAAASAIRATAFSTLRRLRGDAAHLHQRDARPWPCADSAARGFVGL